MNKKTFRMSSARRIVIAAVCVALCYVLPLALHPLGLGKILSPMHLPVLLCGLACGGVYGALCGLMGPVLSSLLSGMPGAAGLITMVPELMLYGLTAGLAMKYIRTGNLIADLYLSLVPAMLLGRVVGGLASACFYLGSEKSFTVAAWISAYFVGTLPGIIVQLILIPALVLALMKTGAIPARYPRASTPEATVG